MKTKTVRLLAAFVALATFAACSSSKKASTGGSGTTNTTASSAPAADFVALGGWKDAACSASQPKVVVGITQPLDVAGTSLKDYVDGTQAAVNAFNNRGGLLGRCLDLKICDGKGDGPTELSCARKQTEDSSMVAGLASTVTQAEGDAYQLFQSAGLPQIGAQVTQPGAWNSPVSFEFTMGGSGTLLAGMPALKNIGVTKFVVFVPASGQVGALASFASPLVKALGMDLVETIQIPATAVEYTQFVLTAQNKSAEGGVLGLPGNVGSQVIDAADSLKSKLEALEQLGDVRPEGRHRDSRGDRGEHGVHRRGPAPDGALDPVPIFDVILDDFKASGKANLTAGSVTAQATNGWLSVYALIKVMRDAKATDITRATVKAAFEAAKDIPMFDLVPPWTPSKQSSNAIFKGISNPMYWTGHWDAAKKDFVVDDKQVDVIALLG